MKWLKYLILLAVLIIVFVFAALGVDQPELPLNFAIWQTPFALSMFWWMLAAFIIGLFFGLINTVWVNFKHRLGARKLRKLLTQANAELERVRAHSVQG